MNTSRSTPASSDATCYACTPFSRTTRPLKAVRACTPSQNPGPLADWWARHTDGATSPSVEEALTTPSDKEVIEDTVSAFRTALRQTDGVESAADLQGDAAPETDDGPSDSLDYFAPAFRQALGREERHMEAHTAETADDTASTTARSGEGTPAESLNYFVPALPSASGQDGQADAVSGAFVEMSAEMNEGTEETTPPEHSLDYFAPAFRRALGEEQHSDSGPIGTRINEETPQGVVEQLKETQLSSLGRSALSDFDLDRLTERFFASPSRELVGLNGG
jgi:hypothetical protein